MNFTATKWDTVADKEKFAKHFKAFVQSDFAESKFPKWFYTRLSMTFGHIAHYNQTGFYDTFFTATADKVRFLNMCIQYGCYGDPTWTYSDVEQHLRAWLKAEKVLERYQKQLADEVEVRERSQLARLKAKYEAGLTSPATPKNQTT